jgi:hypothetical protein
MSVTDKYVLFLFKGGGAGALSSCHGPEENSSQKTGYVL